MRKSGFKVVAPACIAVILFALMGAPALADGGWGFRVDAGALTGTVDGTAFALGFTPDYYLSEQFSLGGNLLLAPTGDLLHVSATGQASFHFRFDMVTVSPYVGLGLAFQDFDGSVRGRDLSEDDTALVIPIGVSFEIPFDSRLSFGVSVSHHFADLDFGPLGDDSSYTGVFATLRYRP